MDRVLFRIWHDILIKYFKYIYFSYCFSWTLEKKTGSYCMGVGLDQIWRGWTFTPAIWSKSKNNKVRYYSYKIKNVKQHKRLIMTAFSNRIPIFYTFSLFHRINPVTKKLEPYLPPAQKVYRIVVAYTFVLFMVSSKYQHLMTA